MSAMAGTGVAARILQRAILSPWLVAGQGAAALAVSMGIGRFVYTPILPLMHAQAGLSSTAGAALATANYIGYLVGALAGILLPRVVRSAAVLRVCLVTLIATLALMPAANADIAWFGLRLIAGVSTALIFVVAVTAVLSQSREHGPYVTGWVFGGVGAGIALSGTLVFAVAQVSDWRTAWWASAALAVLLAGGAWNLEPEAAPAAAPVPATAPVPVTAPAPAAAPVPATVTLPPRVHRWFAALLASYTLEGVGYVIAGTFLVAAIDQGAPAWAGSGAWVLVGLAALPGPLLWARLSRRWSRPSLLLAALVIQAAGIVLPAVAGGVTAALVGAFFFGITFIAIASMVLEIGAHLRFPRAVAVLTTGYSLGQILGPLLVTPLLHHGYHQALVVSAFVVLAAGVAAGVLRVGFPRVA
ncbi:MAG: YbfB/YjiJ family MFS transporter [Streptosporangiaceae bacterium]